MERKNISFEGPRVIYTEVENRMILIYTLLVKRLYSQKFFLSELHLID